MNAAKRPQTERDPYPRMIIVLIAVTLALFLLVAGVMVYDFVARGRSPSIAPGTMQLDDTPPGSAGTVPSDGPTALP